MSPLHIDARSGVIRLPSGALIDAERTLAGLQADPQVGSTHTHDYGTRPFVHVRIDAGQVDERALLAELCYYDETLVMTSLTVNLYPPDANDWSNYSLDVEADTKRLHDRLLEALLGPPTETIKLGIGSLTPQQQPLAQAHQWKYPWGTVHSGHDFKGGGTSIVVRYGDRLEQSTNDYNRRFRREP